MKAIAVIGLGLPLVFGAARAGTGQDKKAFVVRNQTEGPRVMAEGGLLDILRRHGFSVSGVEAVKLTPAEGNLLSVQGRYF